MNQKVLYSVMGLAALPMVQTLAQTQNWTGTTLTVAKSGAVSDGSAEAPQEPLSFNIGKLVPGNYNLAFNLTSKVYDVTVAVANAKAEAKQDCNNPGTTAQGVNIPFVVEDATKDIVISLTSSDPSESGSGYSYTALEVNLSFDFATVKTTLTSNAQTLATTISGYNYAAKDEDADAANALKTKASNVATSYDDYKKFKLYADPNTIQEEIDALAASAAAKEAAYQNEQAYNRVNAAITSIKAKYNAAVAKLEVKLVGAAAYLLDAAKADLNENINQEITTATSASYASYQAGTAVADEATNTAKVPKEDALNAIVDNWEGQAQQNKDAYAALVNVVTTLQANLNAITYNDNTIKAAYAEDSQAIVDAIAAINTTVTGVYNDAAQLTTSVETARAAAQAKIETLAGKVNTANAEFDANKATVAAIAAVQKKLDDAKTAVGAKKSKDTTYPGSTDYYADLVKGIQDEINALSTAAATAYKVDGTGTAQTYNAALSTAAIETEIADYQTNAIAAVEKYDALQDAINGTEDQTGYQDSLDIARDKVKDLKVYIDDTYDYKTKFDLIQKRINDIKKAITAAQAKTGEEHWTAMLVIDADAAIIDDITTLLNNVQTDQNEYDMALLANGLTDIETRIAAINTAADADAYGEDKDSWKAAQQRIADKYTAIKTAKEAVDPEDADAAATIVDLGKQITALQAEQTDLETAAAEVAAKVTANNNLKATLNTNITNLQTTITTFKNTYKIGQDDSTLGNSGKAEGRITKEVGEIVTALETLETTNNAVETTAVNPVVKTVATSGLANGLYEVEVEVEAAAAGTVSVNYSKKAYDAGKTTVKLESVFVSDGTLTAAVSGKDDKVTVKKLTYHENSLDATYNNADEKNPGLNKQYTALAAQETALENAAPGIKTAVENNAATYTAATNDVKALQTTESNTLKNLKNVTNAEAVSDDATAKKDDPANFKVFETDLDAGKTYTAKKAAIDADINALQTALDASKAAETMVEKWQNKSITVGEGDNAKTYSISAITAAINNLKAEAEKESNNYEAYAALQSENMSKLQPDTIFKDMTDAQITELCGADAKDHYTGLKTQYINAKATILNNMQTSLYNRKAVADKDGFVTEINAVIAKVQVVKSDAQANLAKYTEQKAAYTETQTLWNDVYTTIAATDKSSEAQNYLDQLDEIQVELTAATNKVEESYPVGQSVANVQDFAAIKAKINTVKQTQKDTYAVWIAADNAAAHESFKTAIDQATKAYQTAVAERATYSVTNEDVKATIDALAATLDEAIFNAPTQIANLTAEEDEAYVANSELEDPTPFDVSQFNADALAIEQNITAHLNTFKAGVQGALNNFWTPTKAEINVAVAAAEAAIAGYNADAKADAFKDVKDLIAKGDAGVASMTLSEVEGACDGLENYEDMIAADKEAAAAKDIDIASEAATKAYNDAKTYINGKTIADDVNNVKATQLQNLEEAYTDATEALEEDHTFDNHDAIRDALDNVVTVATAAKAAVDAAITADVANTAAYNEVIAAIEPLEAKLAEAKDAAAPYKYATSFATEDGFVEQSKSLAKQYKKEGTAAAHKTSMLAAIASYSTKVEDVLTAAFDTEKTGLQTDINELKNQFNIYVGAKGLDETATAFNTDINALAKRLEDAAIANDDDDPANGQYDEILEATAALVKLQNDIAAKETELLAANGDAANATVLADFQSQIAALEETASLEGYDEWVATQPYGDQTLGEAIEALKAQLDEVKAAIEAEENISFYKDQYQAQINAIKADLVPVSKAIAAKQAQFAANAAAYTVLTAEFNRLQGLIDAAKTKVHEYEYYKLGYYSNEGFIEWYDNGVLAGGAQYDLNEAKAGVEGLNANKNAQNYDSEWITNNVEINVQSYLDRSAYDEIYRQRANLNTLLTNAIDSKYAAQKYSSALWDRLQTEKSGIYNEIVDLAKAIYHSNQTYEGSFNDWTNWGTNVNIGVGTYRYYYTLDENGNRISRTKSCDADLAGQMKTVAAIKAEIETLAKAVENLNLLGDANEDGKVNVLDYQKVVNMILDPTLQPEEDTDLFINLDINQSEIIEVGDLTAIVKYILEGDWQGYAAVKAFGQANESLTMDITQVQQGVQRYAINLQNVEDYTAFQLDVVLPEGMTIVGSSLSERAGESHKLYSRAQMDGSVRLLASSVKGESFSGSEGAVLYIDVETTSDFKGGSVEMLNILFSDVNAQTRAFAIGNGGEATGIDIMAAMQSLKQKVYDLGGRVMNGMRKGVNIIQNADGTTKKVLK